MQLENSVISKYPKKTSRFANCGVFLSGRKNILRPPTIAVGMRRHSAPSIGFEAGPNGGFGAGENDWLGAEAYVDPLR
jgi:hypothetical protein